MGSLYMSSINTKYLVFENSTSSLHMNKISVFANGSEMPWTYYQTDIVDDNSITGTGTADLLKKEDAKRRLMWTSESKESSAGAGDAGKYVSEIKRKTRLGSAYVDEIVKNPTISDYKLWGWPLKKDKTTGAEILPEYGEFAFRPGMAPSYEDASSITVPFKFGFGLNNTCYNFADEKAEISVYNLSSAPKFYLTDNDACNPTYKDGAWNTDMTEATDEKISSMINEGTNVDDNNNPYYKYLLIRVEAGEQLKVERTGSPLGDINMRIEGAHLFGSDIRSGPNNYTDRTINNGTNNRPTVMSAPYKMNVKGEVNEISPSGIKYDFYRIKLSLSSANQDLAFLTNSKKELNLAFTPVVYDEDFLDSFKRNINITLDVSKRITLPFIRDDLQMAIHGFEDVKYVTKSVDSVNDLSDQSNLRVRNIITADEAINYAVSSGTGPDFCRNRTAAQAIFEYKRSILTATEKNLDDYKKQFANEDKMKRFAFYIAMDLSNHALENFQTFDASESGGMLQQDSSGIMDLSNVFNGYRNTSISFYNELFAFKEACTDYLTNKNKAVTYANVVADTNCSSRLSDLYRKMKESPIAESANADRGYNYWDVSGLPHMDTNCNEPRHFGELVDVSETTFMGVEEIDMLAKGLEAKAHAVGQIPSGKMILGVAGADIDITGDLTGATSSATSQNTAHPAERIILSFRDAATDIKNKPVEGDRVKLEVTGTEVLTGGSLTTTVVAVRDGALTGGITDAGNFHMVLADKILKATTTNSAAGVIDAAAEFSVTSIKIIKRRPDFKFSAKDSEFVTEAVANAQVTANTFQISVSATAITTDALLSGATTAATVAATNYDENKVVLSFRSSDIAARRP